ncbi:MAG TPA: efflux RND transporter periplasmic adaptor subunit [Gammaproteobacteria bacterium]|nr:efflux RND transporter periplasmic adaptor subunit [Gammaproteobacteria bacterium]
MNTLSLKTLLCGAMLACLLSPAITLAADADREVLYWVAPMDANYRRDKAGKSPMGMDLLPVYADEAGDNSNVTIAPEIVQNLGIRTATAERSRLWRSIDTVGYVDYDESRVSHIHLRTEGWIEHLVAHSEGERVRKGEQLLELYSPDLVNAQEEFVQALAAGNKGLIRASRARLIALGIPANQVKQLEKTRKVKQTIAIYSPQDGVVSKLMVRHGMFVTPDKQVMSLADLSSVWLLAEIYEAQADWVKVGFPAEVSLAFLPGRTWEGQVEYIYPSLDPKTRTLKARLRFDNSDEALKPNMYANVKIYGGPKEEVIVIPVEALIRTGRESRVVIALGAGKFASRTVTAGIESGDWVEILAGIEPGEEVVTSGQFLLDSEASLKASMTRMQRPGAEVRDNVPDEQDIPQ